MNDLNWSKDIFVNTNIATILNQQIEEKNGLVIMDNQSFEIELEKWGKIKFITATLPDNPSPKLVFLLADDKGAVLYSFSDFVDNP